MRRQGLSAALAAAALLVGCSGDEEKPKEGGGNTTGEVRTATTPEGGTETAPAEAVVPGRQSTIDDDPVQLEVLELQRSGETTALTLRLTVAPGAEESASAQVSNTFDDGENQKVEGGSTTAGYGSMDAISLIDTKNRKRYLVGRDSGGACLCDTDLSSAFVKPGAPLLLSATFGAPPADVEAVDVVVPRFGTFKDVPIS